MLKIFVLQQFVVFPTLNLRNKVLIEFLSGNVLVFLNTYSTVLSFGHSEKELLITNKRRNLGAVAKPT
jgi:hypothetical protein